MRIAEIITEEQLDEFNLRKAMTTAALAGGVLGTGIGVATSPNIGAQPSVSSAAPSPTFTAAQKFSKNLAAKAKTAAGQAVQTARDTRPIKDIEDSAREVADIMSPAATSQRIIAAINNTGNNTGKKR